MAAIRKEHIRKDEETGRYYIFIEDGKTEHAQYIKSRSVKVLRRYC